MPTTLDLKGSASLSWQNEQGCCHAEGANCLSLELQPHSRYSFNNLSSIVDHTPVYEKKSDHFDRTLTQMKFLDLYGDSVYYFVL
jgi:hypothetical protein